MRGKYQREQFLNKINNLSPRQAVMVANYMMKLLFQKLFEPQKDWFAKNGVSLHGSMLANYLQNFKTSIVNLMTNKIGIFLQAALRNHKNTSLLLSLSNISALTVVQVSSFRNLEPQKGKTKLDGHYATLKFSLKRFRREGNDVMSGEQIEKGTNGRLRGTHVYGVSIDRSKEPESAKTMKGITEFSDFYDENENLQYIIARNQTRMLENKRYDASDLKNSGNIVLKRKAQDQKVTFL